MTDIRDNDIYSGREVKQLIRQVLEAEGDVVVSTVQASEMLGHSPDWWRRAAATIPGAYQAEAGGPWSLPLAACREHLAGLRHQGKLRHRESRDGKPFGRRPWRGRQAPQIQAVP